MRASHLIWKTCLAILELNTWITPLAAAPVADAPGEGFDFNFDTITPSSKLVYHRCYGNFECARLLVPLNYQSADPNSETASIAIIKLASNPTEFPEYGPKWGGPVLLNPGGPGQSGVALVLQAGAVLQNIVGQQFSLIGFDPRGVNNTRPAFSCFDDPLDQKIWAVKTLANPMGSTSSGEDIGENFVRAKIFGKLCTSGERGEQSRYLGTVAVTRDMLAINEAMWDLAPNAGRRKGLQYWGMSYGSVLGITFAKMFPDKIERLVVDGILDVNDVFQGESLKNLLDTDAVMDSFYTFCSYAGPLQCVFHTGTRPEHIRKRLQHILTSLHTQPLAYFIPTSSGAHQPELFTYSDLKQLMFDGLLAPLDSFPILAQLFVFVESALSAGFLPADPASRKPAVTCPASSNDAFTLDLRFREQSMAILCSDRKPQTNMTLSEFNKRLSKYRAQSQIFGDVWAGNVAKCVGWNAQSVEMPPVFFEATKNETYKGAAPILLIGNTADSVTPLANAYSMAKLFPKNGTVVAVQEGQGHVSINVPSQCMMDLIRSYFKTGMVPSGRRCAQQFRPFIDSDTANGAVKRDTVEVSALHSLKTARKALNRQ